MERTKPKPTTYELDEVEGKLKAAGLDDWYLEDGWIRRKYNTDGWPSTLMLVNAIGKEKLVLDLSCRKRLADDGGSSEYFVVTDRWQKFTDLKITRETLQTLAGSCAEFLVHAVDVEPVDVTRRERVGVIRRLRAGLFRALAAARFQRCGGQLRRDGASWRKAVRRRHQHQHRRRVARSGRLGGQPNPALTIAR